MNAPGSSERLAALAEIHVVVHRYANLARENAPFDQMAKLFCHDGIFRLPNGAAVNPRDMANVVQGDGPNYIRHHVTTVDAEFISASEARVATFFFAITDKSSMDHWGRWDDTFVRVEGGGWLVADRAIVVDGSDDKGWYFAKYGA